MEINRTEIEIRYQETDQMGVVYHANYFVWFEIGRTKYMNQLGFRYDEIEESGFLSPVIDAKISYKIPVRYGDKVYVETWLEDYDGIRITYGYRILNVNNNIAVTGETKHVVVKKETFKPVLIRKVHPDWHQAYKSRVEGE